MRVPVPKGATAATTAPAPVNAAPDQRRASTTPVASSRAPSVALPSSNRAAIPQATAAAGPAPMPSNAFGVDEGMFNELTDADLQPVALPPKPGAMPKTTGPKKDATDEYVSDEDRRKMAVAQAKQKAELAPLSRRLGAYGIDSFLFFLAWFVPAILAGAFAAATEDFDEDRLTTSDILMFVGIGVSTLTVFGLNAALISFKGQSIGKLLFGLVIVDEETIQPTNFHEGVLVRWIG